MDYFLPLRLIKNYIISSRENRRIKYLRNHGMHIGKNVTIMPEVDFDHPYSSLIYIGDNCSISKHVRFMAHDATTYKYLGYTLVEGITLYNNVFIGERAIILPGVTIGANSIIAAGAVVNKNIPSGKLAAGNPARIYKNFKEFLHEKSEKILNSSIIDDNYFFTNIHSHEFAVNSKSIALPFKKKHSNIYGGSPDIINDYDINNARNELQSQLTKSENLRKK